MLSILLWFFPIGKSRWKLSWKYGVLPPKLLLKIKIRSQFRKRLGKPPDFNKPTTYNEKLQYIKLNRRHPLMPVLADKYRVREILANRGFSDILVKLYGVYEKFEDIDFGAVPSSFAIKVNHDSGGVFIVKDKNKENLKEIGKRISEKIEYPYIHGVTNGEWHYLYISPKIIIEEYLEDESGDLLDYKIHCFEGSPEFIHVDFGRFSKHTRKFYNKQWQPLDFTMGYPRSECDAKRPLNFEQMIEIAEVLSRDFHYCRVDFYEVAGKLYFGEVTFFHGTRHAVVRAQRI